MWHLIRAKSKLLRDGWLFPHAHDRMLKPIDGTLYKPQNVTRYRMSFSYFDVYVCFLQCQLSHDAHTWPVIAHGDSEKKNFLLSNKNVALHIWSWGISSPKNNNLSSFTQPHGVPNLWLAFFCRTQKQGRMFMLFFSIPWIRDGCR